MSSVLKCNMANRIRLPRFYTSPFLTSVLILRAIICSSLTWNDWIAAPSISSSWRISVHFHVTVKAGFNDNLRSGAIPQTKQNMWRQVEKGDSRNSVPNSCMEVAQEERFGLNPCHFMLYLVKNSQQDVHLYDFQNARTGLPIQSFVFWLSWMQLLILPEL